MSYLITASLINSYLYFRTPYGKIDGFKETLARVKKPSTIEQLNGCKFESLCYARADGVFIPEDIEWYAGVNQIGKEIRGGQWQVRLYEKMRLNDMDFLIYGILDVLKAGHIYDIKTTKDYNPVPAGHKFFDNPQTASYFYLCPEARDFTYLIYDFGKDVYRETYYPDETRPLQSWIREMMTFLQYTGLIDIYYENWRAYN